MPMTPNIIHTMKQTVKAKVLTISTDQAWRVRCGLSPGGKGVCAIARFLSFCMRGMVAFVATFAHPSLDQHEGRQKD
jgi:hypothetical protein